MSSTANNQSEERRRKKDLAIKDDEDAKTPPPFQHKCKPSLFSVLLRLLAVIWYTIIGCAALYPFLLLRPLNPLFRRLGLQNSQLPSDIVQRWWAKGILTIAGFTIKKEGTENLGAYAAKDQPVLYMYSHSSNIDGFVMMGWGPHACKYVFKKEILLMNPPIGLLLLGFGHVSINRKNRDSAVKSLTQASHKAEFWGRSIAISPEGSRSKTHELLPFKRGPFYLAHEMGQVGAPIIPVMIYNSFELWPPGQGFPHPGELTMRFLPPITPKMISEMTVDELIDKVRADMVAAKANPPKIKGCEYDRFGPALIFLMITAVLPLFYFFLL